MRLAPLGEVYMMGHTDEDRLGRLTADIKTYTTRWRFERKIPALKIAIASPRLQMACPGIG